MRLGRARCQSGGRQRMSRVLGDLVGTVKALRPFVPAKDFAISKQFYADVGFRVEPLGESLAAMHLGLHSFLLQDFYVEEWVNNFVFHLLPHVFWFLAMA